MNLTETFNTSEDHNFLLYFVCDKEPTEELNFAYETSKEYLGTDLRFKIITDAECKNIPKKELTKTSIFVFDQFAWNFLDNACTRSCSEAFNYILPSKCIILGTKACVNCFLENITIPSGLECIYSFVMKNLIVCPSGLTISEKKSFRSMITKMGGHYTDSLKDICTHLIASSTKTAKYEEAAKRGMTIMHPDWVKDVWKRCLEGQNIQGNDKQFDKFKLPIFYGCCITATGLSTAERNLIKTLIEENGGKYSGSFKSEEVDVLIVPRDKTDSAKFQAALKYRKECLTPDWIHDSVKSGFALPIKEYLVEAAMKASTPTKTQHPPMFHPDSTQLSMISMAGCSKNLCLDETQSSVKDMPLKSPTVPKYKEVLVQMTVQLAKKAGPFLDGCSIYLSGFSSEDKELLNKICNIGSATRFDDLNEQVSHVVVGELDSGDLDVIKVNNLNPFVLSLDWLVTSMKMKCAANEADFVFSAEKANMLIEPPSPASKKSIKSMNNTFKKPPVPKFSLEPKKKQDEDEDKLLQQYLKAPQAQSTPLEQPPTLDSEMQSELDIDFLEKKIVYFHGSFSEEDRTILIQDCIHAGANVVDDSFDKTVDYVICPSLGIDPAMSVPPVKYKECVTEDWLHGSIQENDLLDINYFFRPFVKLTANQKMLKGETFGISSYQSYERAYLTKMIVNLGADFNENFKKSNNPILITPVAEGKKYDAAKLWGFPALRAEWLMECYKHRKRVPEDDFLVGDTIPSKRNNVDPDSSMSSPPKTPSSSFYTPNPEESSFQQDNLFKRPSVSSREETENEEFEFKKPESSETSKRPRKSETSDEESPEVPNSVRKPVEQKEDSTPHKDPESPVRRSLRNRSSFVVDECNVQTHSSPLRHKRVNQLANRKSYSPATPTTPQSAGSEDGHNISELVADMPTPQRQITYDALKEMQNKESPRSKRLRKLLETPVSSQAIMNAAESPMPELPDCMKTPDLKLGLRADASPDNHHWWKRKMESMDPYYCPPVPESKKTKYVPTPPFCERRHELMKELLGNKYDSPRELNTEELVSSVDSGPSKVIQQKSLQFENENPSGSDSSEGSPVPERIPVNPEKLTRLNEFLKKGEKLAECSSAESLMQEEEVVAVVKKTNTDHPDTPQAKNKSIEDKSPHLHSEPMHTQQMGVGWVDQARNVEPNKMKCPRQPVFFMTQINNDQKKTEIVAQIEELGGIFYSHGEFFDPSITHLICDQPNRGQKYLSALAAGRYILHSKYIEDSAKYGFFLEEDRYEFGNPKFSVDTKLAQKDVELAASAYRWRMKIESDEKYKDGAFTGFKVLLISTKEKIPQFTAVINSGGGQVYDAQPPFNRRNIASQGITHCFMETKIKLGQTDIDILKRSKIPTILIIYMNVFLFSEQEPSTSKYLVKI